MSGGNGAADLAKRSTPDGVMTNAPLRRLQVATAATSLGKWAFLVTLGVYAFREGGTAAVGLVAMIQAVPAALAAPLLGLAGDRYPRQRVLLMTNILRALVLAVAAGAVYRGMPTAVIFALAAVFSTTSTASQPARAALIPVLARSPREVSSATAVMGVIDTTSFLGGAGIGGIEALRRCRLFAPLPLATTEGLARRLVPLEVATGAEVITQGDVGDRFYIIADGAVEVIENGVLRRRQGAGESFGEIALLHDVKRTATVRAQVPTHLFALDRDPFLLSVTGHADSHDVGLEVADGFLASSESTS